MNIRNVAMFGVDLSHWNGKVDFETLSKGIDFVMLKIGGEEGKAGKFKPDPKFLENYHAAVAAGLHVGGYFFAGNKKEIICADYSQIEKMCGIVHNFLKENNVFFDMPIALDFENQSRSMKSENTRYVKLWCECMENLNYYVTIYASDVSGFAECLNIKELVSYDKWVARYKSTGPEYVTFFGMWQYTDIGTVGGVEGVVDGDKAYINYPEIISRKGLNR